MGMFMLFFVMPVMMFDCATIGLAIDRQRKLRFGVFPV
jgi:hypothetical protein